MKAVDKIIIFILVFLYLTLTFIIKKQSQKEVAEQYAAVPVQPSEEQYHLACPFSGAVYLSEKSQVIKKVKTQALIVPHHLLAKDLINQAMENTSQDYQTIILIGPNHFNLGQEEIQTTRYDWKTKFGNLSADKTLINKIIQNDYAKLNPDYFNTEHSVCGLVSFVRKQFPRANLVPLILKSTAPQEKNRKLGQFLAQNCDDCLLLASLDFSHEVNEWQANINDQQSIKILTEVDEENLNQITCDSLPSLEVLFTYLKTKRVSQGKLINQSNSNQISSQSLVTVTSYLTMIFE